MSHGIQWSFPAFSCLWNHRKCVIIGDAQTLSSWTSGKDALCLAFPDSIVPFLPSRYQEDLKKTKEFKGLKEEEEEQKSEGPEEPEEAEDSEEEGKDQRSRLEPLTLPKWVMVH